MAGQVKASIAIAVVIIVTAVFYYIFVSFFPLTYAEEVTYAAEQTGLDEELIRAVIWTESKYRADAVSPSGATGLMQMLPSTRREVSENCGVTADGSPRSEILLGSLYLREMLLRTGSERDALMAYNAGYANVAKWQSGGGEPFKETADYVVRVAFARRIYSLL